MVLDEARTAAVVSAPSEDLDEVLPCQVHERGVDADLLSMVIKLLMLLASILDGVQFPSCS